MPQATAEPASTGGSASAAPGTSDSSPAPAGTPTCDLTGPWQLILHQSGGFAGVDWQVQVDHAGLYVVEDLGGNRRVEGVAAAARLQDITRALAALCDPPVTGRLPPCPDCFTYALSLRLDGAVYEAELTDQTLVASPLAPLVEQLSLLQTEAWRTP